MRHRFARVRLTVREWRHRERGERAYERHAASVRAAGGGISRLMAVGTRAEPADAPPLETEQITRLWWEKPDRVRPAVLLGTLDLHPTSDIEVVAGRRARRVHAHKRDLVDPLSMGHHPPGGADAYELSVDLERGIVLRLSALVKGEPFAVTEVTEIEFDEPFPPDIFVFAPPPGEEVHPFHLPTPEPLTLMEVARRAPFTVLVPRRVPAGAERTVGFIAPHARPPQPAVVILSYRVHPSFSITVSETSAAEDTAPFEPADGEEIERGGRRVLFRAVGTQRQLVTLLHGTRAFLLSDDADRDAMVETALSLEPAPTKSPPLEG